MYWVYIHFSDTNKKHDYYYQPQLLLLILTVILPVYFLSPFIVSSSFLRNSRGP